MNGSRILIVEDEALIAADLEMQLMRMDYLVINVVDTGEDAVEQATNLQPDLILMDIRLKGNMDGIEAAEIIRSRLQIPVVFLTSHTDPATLQRASSAEPLGYLVKPFDRRELHATIETALYRHQAEVRLRSMERWLATTLQSIGDGVLTTDRHGRVTFLNPTAENLTGWTQHEALGRPFTDVFSALHKSSRERIVDPVTQAMTQNTIIRMGNDVLLRNKKGIELPIDDSVAPIYDDAKQITGAVVIFRDFSQQKMLEEERHRIEEKLRESQKFESLGVLASGIAHDFNNLLSVILGHANLCQMDLPATSPLQTSLKQIEVSSHYAAELCKQMLTYAGQGPVLTQRLNINNLVEDTTQLLRVAISKQAILHLNLATSLPEISGDHSQLQQILMNLVINASEAFGDTGGHIRITTGVIYASPDDLTGLIAAPDFPAGSYVFLEVGDTGSGMSQETMAKIFDPFFTTKFTGRGLGLAAVLGIVRRHSGALQVQSTPGEGSSFRLLLPTAATPQAAMALPELPPSLPANWRGTGTIMIVDDDPLVRNVTRRLAAIIGFDAVEAGNGHEALALCQAPEARFVAVILDLTMPGMDGVQTLRGLRQIHPHLPVIMVSGYADETVARTVSADPMTTFLPKPFSPTQLREQLRAFLP